MDLRAWLLDAHDGMRQRVFGGVVAHVPTQRWGEHADGGGSSIAGSGVGSRAILRSDLF